MTALGAARLVMLFVSHALDQERGCAPHARVRATFARPVKYHTLQYALSVTGLAKAAARDVVYVEGVVVRIKPGRRNIMFRALTVPHLVKLFVWGAMGVDR
jgi:hypothetical protein